MDRLVFTSLSGAKTGTIQRTMLTNELANVSTIGLKRASFQRAVPAQLDGPGFAVRCALTRLGAHREAMARNGGSVMCLQPSRRSGL